jgi:iron complex transport system substrate-binding protein
MVTRRAWLIGLAAALVSCRRDHPGGAPPEARVVSLAPSTTEAMFALGTGDRLVGRSDQCDFPPEVERLPVVGGFAAPSIEAVVALRPTLVVGARGPAGPALEGALRAHGIATFFPETESIAQIRAMIAELGRLVGHEVEAAAVLAAIASRLDEIARAVAGRTKPRVAMLFDVTPIVAAGPEGFPNELVTRAGGVNVVQAGGAYPAIGLEHLLVLDPDVILDGSMDPRSVDPRAGVMGLREAPGWRELRALREGRVHRLDGTAALRPGPRVGEGVASIARALHGQTLDLSPAKARW